MSIVWYGIATLLVIISLLFPIQIKFKIFLCDQPFYYLFTSLLERTRSL